MSPQRVAARKAYQQTEKGAEKANMAKRRYAERNADKRAAHIALGNALRNGTLQAKPCEVCGHEPAEGHHFDYTRPLDVIWLCMPHHIAHHKIERAIKRKQAA